MSEIGHRLEALVGGLGSAVVAYSGGIDSTLVAAYAARMLDGHALAVTAVSPALATGELDAARRVAEAIGIRHETADTDELAREGYRRNGADRCYFCKDTLYTALERMATSRGFAVVVSGANTDDLGDFRPGLRAAAEHGVRHPLVEAGIDKAGVRRLARELGLPNAEKVASPCLASRIPYGREVRPEVLQRIDRAEAAVRARGYDELRVRDHGELGRLEIAEADVARALRPLERRALEDALHAAGYPRAEVAETPLRSGSLNDALGRLPVVTSGS